MKRRFSERLLHQRGFSLVELLVAAVILGIVIASVVAVVRKSREIDTTDNHRREARAVVDSLLETRYHVREYNTIGAVNSTRKIIIDPVLDSATVRETVVDPSTVTAADGDIIPVKRVTVSVVWTEPDGRNDTITAVKWLAK